MKRDITPEVIRQLFTYNPTNGSLCWRDRAVDCFATPRAYSTWNKRFANKEAGGLSGFGYLYVTIYGHLMLKHRVVWAYVYGEWPENQIDHINGNRLDNSISNLRHVTHAENGRNAKKPSNNTSGTAGVSFHFKSQKWRSYIKSNQKVVHLGLFENKDDAIAVRKLAEKNYGFHKNHGR